MSKGFLLLKRKGVRYPTQRKEVECVVAAGESAMVYLKSGEKFCENHCLKYYERLLCSVGLLIRIDRFMMVKLSSIKSYQKTELILKGGATLELSEVGYLALEHLFEEQD